MHQIKKQQHYVWKKYLAPWGRNNQVATLLKSSNKIIHSNPANVVQQRFFYALEEYTEEEEIILKELVTLWSSEDARQIALEFYERFTSYSKLKRAFKNKNTTGFNITQLEHKLNVLRTNTMEDMHADIEKFGDKLIAVTKFDDLRFLDDNDELFKTMFYISFQYLRTKNMSEALKTVFPKYEYLSEKFLNMVPFIHAPGMAFGLTFNKEIKFIYYDNKTDVDFLTSDQPVINEKKHILKDVGVVGQMDLFYPLSPKNAIVIHYQEQDEIYKYVLIAEENVIEYNKLMVDSSKEFVFASRNIQLAQYMEITLH